MSETEYPRGNTAELFVRSDLPAPSEKRRTAIEARLQELSRNGVLDRVLSTTWAKRVPLDSCGECLERRRFDDFATWARDTGVSLTPFFDTRTCYSFTTGDRETQLVMPVLCLAVYSDGRLDRLAPYADDGSFQSVEDCLTDLADEGADQEQRTVTVSTAD